LESSIIIITALGLIAGALLGMLFGYFVVKKSFKEELATKKAIAESLLSEAKDSAERLKREKLTEAKEEALKLRQEVDKEVKERRSELQRAERRLEQKEENLDKKLDRVSQKEEEIKQKLEDLNHRIVEAEKLKNQQVEKLELIAEMTKQEARDVILKKTEEEAQYAIGMRIKELEEKAKREADRKAREIIITAIQRTAVEYTSDATVSVVPLPSDEMKGRIIGREGRNIRTFEALSGVDLIVDDTPEAVIISCFDPLRREIAKIALERLVNDGRIHPARIEELQEKATRDVEEEVIDAGESATLETGIKNLHGELLKTLGLLKFRYSYGQNILSHSLEVAYIAGIIAAELGVDEELARRSGLLHDIGKAVDSQVGGSHDAIGAELARRHGEKTDVISAIASHHENIKQTSINDVIIAVADAISASRPGARRESLDTYVKRIEKIEEIARSFPNVSKAYAIQAGREIRVVINPINTDDGIVDKLAYDTARKIEEEMKYPGQIKIVVSREVRAIDYAK
jgi:ribonuclease Y